MSEQLIVIDESGGSLASRFAAAKPVTAVSPKQLHSALGKYHEAIFVGRPAPMMKLLVDSDLVAKMSHRLLLLSAPKDPERAWLNAVFKSVVAPNETMGLLKTAELAEVLASPRRANLFVGGVVVAAAKSVLLFRGNLESLLVPFALFKPLPNGPLVVSRPGRRSRLVDQGNRIHERRDPADSARLATTRTRLSLILRASLSYGVPSRAGSRTL